MEENNILNLPKRNNYHYNVEYVDGAECIVIYYRLSDNMWDRHVEYCKEHGFENKFNQWLRVLVDIEDFDKINGWSLNLHLNHLKMSSNSKSPFIRLFIQKSINKKMTTKLIYRHTLSPPKDKQVDHINCNPLDNRKCNLRLVTNAENMQNRNGCQSNSKTGVRGVSIFTVDRNTKYEKQYYSAEVMLNSKHVFKKTFPLTHQGLIDAEKAVVEARLKYFTHNEVDKGACNE